MSSGATAVKLGMRKPRAQGLVILVDALAARFGGTAYVAVQTSLELARHERVDRVVVVARAASIVARGIGGRDSCVKLKLLRRADRLELARRVTWQAAFLPRLVEQLRADGLLTFSGILPRPVNCRVVAHLSNPVMFERPGGSNRVRQWAIRRTVRSGAGVIVPSQGMARLAAIGGRSPDVVPHGLNHYAFRPAARPGQDVLCVADFYPHKRHDIVLAAWAALPEPRPRLRLIGDPSVNRRHFKKIHSQAAELMHLGAITFESGLSLREVASAYRSARALLLPSAHESFCLPLAESLASGVPAIVRDLPQLRETGGAGALYIDGDDPAAWSTALRGVLEDDGRHAAMRRQGIVYAARYSWRALADAVVERLVEERDG